MDIVHCWFYRIGCQSFALLFSDIMIVSDQQKSFFKITVFGAVVNIILNIILIPKYSLYGAAFATVITYILIFLMYIRYSAKLTPVCPFKIKFVFVFFLALFSSVLMYLAIIQPLIYNLNIFLSVIIGAVIYFTIFFGLNFILKFFNLYDFNK